MTWRKLLLLPATDAVFLGLTKYGVDSLHPGFAARPLNRDTAYHFYAIALKTEITEKKVKRFIDILKEEIS